MSKSGRATTRWTGAHVGAGRLSASLVLRDVALLVVAGAVILLSAGSCGGPTAPAYVTYGRPSSRGGSVNG